VFILDVRATRPHTWFRTKNIHRLSLMYTSRRCLNVECRRYRWRVTMHDEAKGRIGSVLRSAVMINCSPRKLIVRRVNWALESVTRSDFILLRVYGFWCQFIVLFLHFHYNNIYCSNQCCITPPVRFILWCVEPLLCNDREMAGYTRVSVRQTRSPQQRIDVQQWRYCWKRGVFYSVCAEEL
jgi:hypothetical protein